MEPLTLTASPALAGPAEKLTASHVEIATISSPSSTGSQSWLPVSPSAEQVATEPSLDKTKEEEEEEEQEPVTATATATTETTTTTTTTRTKTTNNTTTTTTSIQVPTDVSDIPTPPPAKDDEVTLTSAKTLDEIKTAARPQTPQMFTMRQVAQHNNARDLWLVIDNDVYDCTDFAGQHPGGAKILNGVAGKDATKKFDKYHRRYLLEKYKPALRVGVLDLGETMSNTRKGFFGKLGFGGGGGSRNISSNNSLR